MTAQSLDQARVDAFGAQMTTMLNNAFSVLAISLGHRTGLFDAMAGLPPSTSDEVAEAAGLNDRYVREWLGAMVVSHIVEYDAATRRYSLPPEHAAWLTRAAGPRNIALRTQFVGLLGGVEAGIAGCFKDGGGLDYAAYGEFTPIMAQMSGVRFDALLLQRVLPSIPGLVDRLRAGIDVLDVGCGSGRAVRLMAEAFPHSRFTGADFSEAAIAGRGRRPSAWG